MTNSRRTYLDITYNNQNLSTYLAGQTKHWSFTDNLSGQIDDLQLIVDDVETVWLDSWFPSKGSTIVAAITKNNWTSEKVKTKIGRFEVDEIDAKGPPTDMTIKALAVPERTSIRSEYKSKAWEKTTLKVVANDIAKANGLKLYYQANENPKKDRYEQESETDLAFLYRLCNDEGLCLKISNLSIVILDEADYERKPTVEAIYRDNSGDSTIEVKNWSARTTLTGTYKDCRVETMDSNKKKAIKATFTPPKAPKVGRTLVVKQDVKSVGEAQRLAKNKLREANKDATTLLLEVLSEKHLDAGMTVDLKKFGWFDGKYIITQVVHSPEFVTLQVRKCLEGY
ncbi:hypothetical protein F9U64_18960 [Gracilibacillus oryzae]|uniref:Phage late control D family protein n=1 Tax=Gracilibacillus oryzae TaxID=1672701 RepID=A0A7C8GR60_9BACI|nr:contractile injection system protein, VgrG/Pvc8 family [Gracilibacillus oryzae]KAB8126902.1 hypothetical protein F9U64_18960 [Gracilibacillus oryzae]